MCCSNKKASRLVFQFQLGFPFHPITVFKEGDGGHFFLAESRVPSFPSRFVFFLQCAAAEALRLPKRCRTVRFPQFPFPLATADMRFVIPMIVTYTRIFLSLEMFLFSPVFNKSMSPWKMIDGYITSIFINSQGHVLCRGIWKSDEFQASESHRPMWNAKKID